jgi:molybdenum cofactor synthesis domain-containing protein
VNDENGAYAVKMLRRWGVAVKRLAVVADDLDDIGTEINACRQRYTYVISSGGIGPTHDDITMAAIAKAFGVEVVRAPVIVEKLRAHFGAALLDAHLRLAEIPAGAELIAGEGLPVIRKDNVYILPGIPELFRSLLDGLRPRFEVAGFFGRAVLLGCEEPEIAAEIAAIQREVPSVAIGSYPTFRLDAPYRVKVTCEGRDAHEVERVLAMLLARLPRAAIIDVETY